MYLVMIPFLCSIGISFHEMSSTVELMGLPLTSVGGEDGSEKKKAKLHQKFQAEF